MAYGDKAELNIDGVYRITTNGGTDVVLSPAAEEGRTTPGAGGGGAMEPAITTIDLNGAGALSPAANGSERYRVRIERLR